MPEHAQQHEQDKRLSTLVSPHPVLSARVDRSVFLNDDFMPVEFHVKALLMSINHSPCTPTLISEGGIVQAHESSHVRINTQHGLVKLESS